MSDPVIEQIKQRVDVVELIQEYLPLQKAGSNWRGLCPFHNEKSPSFTVSADKQIWHCFGCSKGGDIFTFVQEIEGGEFGEVLRKLADRAGVVLPQRQARASERNDLLLHIVSDAKQFFVQTLRESQEADIARRYLAERGIQAEAQAQFGLGYSYNDWRKLLHFLQQRKYAVADIIAAGLALQPRESQGEAYDRFRGRLMIPLTDHHGSVVGFTARTLQANDEGGKYINSPQSALYDKSKLVYGLAQAKVAIKKLGAVILVEGNLDVITAHQAGFTNVVATSGTAFTVDQLQLLKRYTKNLLLAFDMDAAGQKAAERGVTLAWQHGLNVKIMTMPVGYKDPDECIRSEPALFKVAVKQGQNVMDWWFEHVTAPLDLRTVDHKKKAAQILLPIITQLPDTVEQVHYIQKLADLIQVEPTLLQAKIKPLRTPIATPVAIHSRPGVAAVEQQAVGPKDRSILLSSQVLALALSIPDQFTYVAEYLDPAFLTDPVCSDLYKRMLDHYNKAGQFVINDYLQDHSQDSQFLDRLELQRTTDFPDATAQQLQSELIRGMRELHKAFIQRRLKALEIALRQAETQDQLPYAEQLLQELQLLTQQLTDLSR